MTADDFRRFALQLEGAVEGAHMGHPDFRLNGRIFATLHAGDRTGMVKVSPEEQAELVGAAPEAFAPAAGAWGRQGCTTVTLEAVGEAELRGALILAWERAGTLPPSKPARPPRITSRRKKR